MGSIIAIIFAIVVYRHASGKAKYNRAMILIMCVLALLPCLIAAYIGYRHNPNHDKLRFRDVL